MKPTWILIPIATILISGCASIGTVTDQARLVLQGLEGKTILDVPLEDLKTAWKKTFGELI